MIKKTSPAAAGLQPQDRPRATAEHFGTRSIHSVVGVLGDNHGMNRGSNRLKERSDG